jgi:AraC family transcriptional regulator
LLGITVFKYVQVARFKRAAYKLAFRDDSVISVALDCGYEGPEAFARAFKKRVGCAPSDVKKHPELALCQPAYQPAQTARRVLMSLDANSWQVEIINFPETRVAVLEHRGDPALLGASIRKFIEWRRREKLPPSQSDTFNILYDNPAETPPERFRLDLCAATDKVLAPNDEGVIIKVIPFGRCALLRHVGSEEGFIEALRYIYAEWLPSSGEEPRDFPLFCRRVRFYPDVPEHEAVTEIFLPLK